MARVENMPSLLLPSAVVGEAKVLVSLATTQNLQCFGLMEVDSV